MYGYHKSHFTNDAFHITSSAMSVDFPKIQGGVSLILAWQIKGKNVLVIGGGEVGTWPCVLFTERPYLSVIHSIRLLLVES
jgi:hypothetical protein